MTPEERLDELLDKQAVYEVVMRYCRGIDRLDLDAVRDCYHPDGVDHHTGFTGNRDDYVRWVGEGLRRFDGTMHLVGNHLVEVEGDVAWSETYGNAHHWGTPPEDPALNFVSGFRYVDRLERRDGGWRIAERHAVREWTRAIPPGVVRPKEGAGPAPRRDPSDPVYLIRRTVEG
ncbi:MAG TPA: nuclear transport factor 2 family protein [Acidimicrobiales bacterium]|nr:nuclear transport factor 2 family protein [Acidimicrobiales bacterium]